MSRHYYETVTEAISALKERSYIIDFQLSSAGDYVECPDKHLRLSPASLQIEEVYRFEGSTDPADEMIVLAPGAPAGGIKGFLAMAYGSYAEATGERALKAIPIAYTDIH